MATGKTLLRAILDAKDIATFRKTHLDIFLEGEEQEAYKKVKAHLDTYNVLPTVQEMAEEKHVLPPDKDISSIRGTIDILKRRYLHNAVRDRQSRFVEAMKNQDSAGITEVLTEMLREAKRFTIGETYATMGEQYGVVQGEYNIAKVNPGLRGITTGWETLDIATNGLMGGDLVVIAGRPSMGKSWLIMQMAHAASSSEKRIAFCSMEMSLKQIGRRWLGLRTGVNPNFIRAGEIGDYAEERMFAEMEVEKARANQIRLLGGDMAKAVSSVEGMILEFQPQIVFVDAAYLLTPSGKKNGYVKRWEAVTEVVQELKQIALRYDIPVVISVQFNRNQTNRSKKAFDMGDIGGSDSIPQDASIVLGVRDGPSPNDRCQRIIEVMKNREICNGIYFLPRPNGRGAASRRRAGKKNNFRR